MRKKIIFEKDYSVVCSKNNYLNFVNDIISIKNKSSHYKTAEYSMYGEVTGIETIEFHYPTQLGITPNPKCLLSFIGDNEDVTVIKLKIEITFWLFYEPIINAFFFSLGLALTTKEILISFLCLPFFVMFFYFIICDLRINRKLLISEFEEKMRQRGLEYSCKNIYNNKYY